MIISRLLIILLILKNENDRNYVCMKALINKLMVYQKYGFITPKGVVISNIKNITIGDKFKLSPYCYLFAQGELGDAQICIGNNVGLNYNVMINADCGGSIQIGDDVSIGPYTVIRASNHNFERIDIPIKAQKHVPGTIVIETDVWIGAHVVILPNIKIGHSSVIGAGSIVTKDIPPFSVVVGNPARIIKTRKIS